MTTKSEKDKWEKILEKHGLGLVQPLTDNSEGELANAPTPRTKNPDSNSGDFARLRTKLDGSDLFMEAHQIKKVRSIEREIPEWAMNNEAVQKIILTSFPALRKNKISRDRAARWVRLIYLYYRMQLPRQIVAKELKVSDARLSHLIRGLNRAAKGLGVRNTVRKVTTPRPPREGNRGKGNENNQGPPLPRAGNGGAATVGTSRKEVQLP